MLFNSLVFVLFSALFFLIWHFIKKKTNLRLVFITFASFFFYGWWDWRFLFLILFSGIVDYLAAIAINSFRKYKKILLISSLLTNIGTLAIFKYLGFISENIDAILGTNLHNHIDTFFLITPVGISFYTFQSMSYTIDVYKDRLNPTKNIIHFFAYLSMFPQLVAGPIIRARELLPQLIKYNPITSQDKWDAFRLIIKGYFKKLVIADNLAPIVVTAFNDSAISSDSTYYWGAIIAFAFQIYCDFSGYSDIASGLARFMGYKFPINFNHPYISTSLREFWTRWHISLSSWFRDYVYIELGGNKKGKIRTHINQSITMLLSGLWHGASYTFIMWGAFHSLLLSLEKVLNFPQKAYSNIFLKLFAWAFVTIEILVAWVFFRANSLEQAFKIIKTMFSFTGSGDFGWGLNGSVFIFIMLARGLILISGIEKKLRGNYLIIGEMLFYALLIAITIYFRGNGSEFIYFQF